MKKINMRHNSKFSVVYMKKKKRTLTMIKDKEVYTDDSNHGKGKEGNLTSIRPIKID